MSDESNAPSETTLSRRDFLRRAGREAVDTGTKIVPGANLARAAAKTPWWKSLARWRQQRKSPAESPSEKESDESADPE